MLNGLISGFGVIWASLIFVATVGSYVLSFVPCFFGNLQNNVPALLGGVTSMFGLGNADADGLDVVSSLGVSLLLQFIFMWPRLGLMIINIWALGGWTGENVALALAGFSIWFVMSMLTTAINLMSLSWLQSVQWLNPVISGAIVLVTAAVGIIPAFADGYDHHQILNVVQLSKAAPAVPPK